MVFGTLKQKGPRKTTVPERLALLKKSLRWRRQTGSVADPDPPDPHVSILLDPSIIMQK
jgi:hypothetical protein